MKSCDMIKSIYEDSKLDLNELLYGEKHTEENLLLILDKLTFEKAFNILNEETYNLDEISKIFRYYEEELKNYFETDKCVFEWLFKCYTIVTKVFTELCLVFSINKEKINYIHQFLQLLKESNNMVKFFIPLEESHIKILNNLIGEQLYYFTHLEYKNYDEKDLGYILDDCFMSLEKQFHGYELSSLSEFGHKEFVDEKSEYMIFMNNVSFLLLKILFILKTKYKQNDFFDNVRFKDILEFYQEISQLNSKSDLNSLEVFETSLIKEFLNSNKYLNENKDYDVMDEKIKLLEINTDEYKQLIDIISSSKH